LPTVQQLYDRWHADRFARYDETTPGAPWHLMARKHIPEGSLRGKTVSEAGCGFGQFALWLAEQGGDVTAGDLSVEACRIARDICGDRVDIDQLDVQNLVEPLGRDRFRPRLLPRNVGAGRRPYFTHGPGVFSWASDRARSGRALKIVVAVRHVALAVEDDADPHRGGSPLLRIGLGVRLQAARRQACPDFWRNKAGSWLGVTADSTSIGSTTVWRQVSVSRTAPSGTAFVRIEFRQSGVGTSWWDDVSLTSGTGSLSTPAATSTMAASKGRTGATAFHWDGRSFRTARELRLDLVRRGVK
jgi:SAM-dependent methyltransferase